MGKRAEQEPTAIRLYAEGLEIPAISDELGVSENSLREWKRRAGSEWDEARSAFRRGQVASFEDVGRRVQRARDITARLTGDAKSQGQMGLSLNEALQTMLYDIMGQMATAELDADSMSATIEQMKGLATILQKTEQAANLNLKREAEIRSQALKDAADKMENIAKQGGMPTDTIQTIRREILGIKS